MFKKGDRVRGTSGAAANWVGTVDLVETLVHTCRIKNQRRGFMLTKIEPPIVTAIVPVKAGLVKIPGRIAYVRPREGLPQEQCSVAITGKPRPEFYDSVGKLLPLAVKFCCLGREWLSFGSVAGVEFSGGDEQGVSARILVRWANEEEDFAIDIKTPWIRHDQLTIEEYGFVLDCQKEALLYVLGKTAQLDLFDQQEEAA